MSAYLLVHVNCDHPGCEVKAEIRVPVRITQTHRVEELSFSDETFNVPVDVMEVDEVDFVPENWSRWGQHGHLSGRQYCPEHSR